MPVSLKNLKDKVKQLEVDIEGDALNITYKVHSFTPALESIIRDCEKDDRASDALIQMLLKAIQKWDFLGEDGKSLLSITEENLKLLSFQVLRKLMTAIQEDNAPPKAPSESTSSF